MKTIACSVLLSLLSLNMNACDPANPAQRGSESRMLPLFYGIELTSAAHVFLTQGDEQSVRIEAGNDVLPEITTEVRNQELIIGNRNERRVNGPVNVYIVVKDLCLLELSGPGNIITQGQFNCDNIAIRLTGTGLIRSNLSALNLKVTLSGCGILDLGGFADHADIRIKGSGDVNAQDLSTFSVAVSILGSGNTRIDAQKELSVNISGTGHVYYVHEPGIIRSTITGAGDLIKI